jgi:CelD/BcsL family acetyltransferase involved in cellulose biosynthesis
VRKLKTGWRRLQSQENQVRFYQTYEWFECVADHLITDEKELIFVVAESHGEIVGVFPLQVVERVRSALPIRALQLPQHPHIPLCDFIVDSSLHRAELFAEFLRWLNNKSGLRWDVLQMERSPIGSCADTLISESSPAMSISHVSGSIAEIGCADGDGLSHLSGRFARNLARLERRARRLGELSFVSCSGSVRMTDALDQFIEVEDDSWKGTLKSSIASSDVLKNFYTSVARRFDGEIACRINLLRLGDETIAAQFGIISAEVYFMLKIGYRQQYSALGPGNLLLAAALKQYARDPSVKKVNLVTCPTWADKWQTHASLICARKVMRPSIKGALLYATLRTRHQNDSLSKTERAEC